MGQHNPNRENGMGRLASQSPILAELIKRAYNADFQLYIDHFLQAHDMPRDPAMNWPKWIDRVFANVPPKSEELRDEAVHHVMVKLFIDDDILSKFDSTRLSTDMQDQPLEKQITSYIKNMLIFNKKTAIRYLQKAYHHDEETIPPNLTHNHEHFSLDNLLEEVGPGGETNHEIESFLSTEIADLRRAFHNWVDGRNLKVRETILTKSLFDFVIVYDLDSGSKIGDLL